MTTTRWHSGSFSPSAEPGRHSPTSGTLANSIPVARRSRATTPTAGSNPAPRGSAIPRHVVISSSTGEGLIQLAQQEGASVVVFGSDYRTPPGRAEPGNTAQRLLDGGPVAVAVAAAGLRARPEVKIESIAAFGPGDDAAVAETVRSLADKLGATVNPNGAGRADLIVVGSPPSGGPGRTGVSGLQRSVLNTALGSVLVLPYGKPLVL
jgi:nucleotide-binding universal stress UspA family protein